MPFFAGASGQVHYRRWQLDEPRAGLVFLPGTGQHTGHYHRFARKVARVGIETWAIDHVGHGLSEGDVGDAALADLAANAARLVAIAGQDRPGLPLVLMGHSLGAATAVRTDPAGVVGLVLCGTPASITAAEVALPTLPTLLVHGMDDRRCPIDAVRGWAAARPDSTLREYADAGHDLLHEPCHAVVTHDVAEWILARTAS